ncbi:MAG: PQQ-dependent sugar dehydrogenase [Solirubrobacteraceae bacterium]|nr:PQQ-dependent sugar dehydrogenase [Solirubrobacteraceae bacterium]
MTRARTLLLTGLGALTLGLAACGEEQSERDAARDPLGPASTSGADAGDGGSTPEGEDPTKAEASDQLKRGEVKTVASGIEVPWDIAFLPDGEPLVSERDRGQIVSLPTDGSKPTVIDVKGVSAAGEGGLLGIAVSPDYEQDRTVFAYLTSQSDNRIVAIDTRTKAQKPILTGLAKNTFHNGGALEFGPDGKLYAGVGDAGASGSAQDRSSRNGKILRIDPDGGVPAGNPIDGSPVWSLGHRNVQGLAWDGDDRLWASEFGQNDVDEVNLIAAGKNYGWPDVEGDGDTQGGKYTSPVATWSPTATSSPSGAAIVGDELYVSALAGRTLWQIALDGTKAGEPKSLFPEKYGRIRAVATAPDGTIWFSTSNTDGRGDPADDDDKIFKLGV